MVRQLFGGKLSMENNELEFVCVEFHDPTYASGWVARKDMPTIQESIQIGCGILIEDKEDHIIIGTCVNKDNLPTDDVFTLFLINRTSIIKLEKLCKQQVKYDKKKKVGKK